MDAKWICTLCLNRVEPEARIRGSSVIELILWCCFLLPGIVYGLWRMSTQYEVCTECGSTELIPVDSPRGRQLLGGA